ncbi:MAG TPA: electron transfer flavoprotein subunit alpha/FixB family protein, partial [Bacillota bacterium]
MIVVAGWGGEGVSRAQRELVTVARRLAEGLGQDLAFLAVGPDAETAARAAGAFGVRRAVAVAFADDGGAVEGIVENLAQGARHLAASVVLLAADFTGVQAAPRLAARLGGAALNDVVDVRVEDGRTVWTRPVFGGKALADMALRRSPAVVTIRPGSFEAAAESGGEAAVESLDAVVPDVPVRVVDREEGRQGGPRLEEARVVVSGGRGLGGPEGFQRLAELAQLLDGAVGASLAAVDEGWAPPEWQVGQTGKMVSPDVYFAVGISGASQHL